MTTEEPKLLTETEWRKRITASEHFTELAISSLRNAGLIAPEPLCKGPHMDLTHMTDAQCSQWLRDAADNVELAYELRVARYIVFWEPRIMRAAADRLVKAESLTTDQGAIAEQGEG